jgi:hypothetical protein
LVLPIEPGHGGGLWAVLTVTTLQAGPVLIGVDERTRASAPGRVGPVDIAVPLGPGVGDQPVEISFRNPRRLGRLPVPMGLVVQCLRLTGSRVER